MSALTKDGTVSHTQWTALLEACIDPTRKGEIVEVSFNHKRLRDIPREVLGCPNLSKLSLYGNMLKEIPSIRELRSLTSLNVGENKLVRIPDDWSYLQKLAILSVEHNHIRQFPKSIAKMKNLTTLHVSNNSITDLTPLTLVPSLTHITAAFNELETLPHEICKLKNLQILDVCDNNLTAFPFDLLECSRLSELYMSGNNIAKLPETTAWYNLRNLQEFYIDNNELSNLPNELALLAALDKLSVGENSLAGVPSSLAKLPNLEELNICQNTLTDLNCMVSFDGLAVLNANENEISSLPTEIGSLVSLQELRLTYNQLQEIPEELCLLTNLVILHLSHNRITRLPVDIHKLVNLEELYISHNMLEFFPQALCELVNLVEIDVDHNEIPSLPSSISNLQRLEFLWIKNNNLTELPRSLVKMPNLQELKIHNNPLKIPMSVINNGIHSLHAFLKGQYNPPTRDDSPYYYFKASLKSKVLDATEGAPLKPIKEKPKEKEKDKDKDKDSESETSEGKKRKSSNPLLDVIDPVDEEWENPISTAKLWMNAYVPARKPDAAAMAIKDAGGPGADRQLPGLRSRSITDVRLLGKMKNIPKVTEQQAQYQRIQDRAQRVAKSRINNKTIGVPKG
eukprot:TRINITY_DN62856_c0_g2_i1.p1 TRINITY_DN62856_c0_g2~~TRINITY_DN62856_c0_g2_i1.p1  ORF type:complete len:625 (-),score=36.65 TRINITY_DN62856_c0_g2_i1:1177-3051(-)